MEAKTANEVPLRKILNTYGRDIIRSYHGYDMYQSPFREETHPSFQVRQDNTWKDFGSGEYGSAIDLVIKLEQCTFLDAMKIFESGKFGINNEIKQIKIAPKEPKTKKLIITKVAPLQNKALLNYMKAERGIDPAISSKYCKEVYYIREGSNQNLYAVAFMNDSGGMEYRNGAGYKGAFINKDITTIDNGNNNQCAVFEGFIDFLSYLQMTKGNSQKQNIDFVILNSVSMVEKAIPFLQKYKCVNCFLDNDAAGLAAYNKIKQNTKQAINESHYIFSEYKDLNEYLTDQLKKNRTDKTNIHPRHCRKV